MTTIGEVLSKILAFVMAAGKVIISAGALVFAILGVLLQFGDVESGLLALSGQLDSLTLLIHGLPLHPVMNMVNRIFPVTELLGLISGYLSIFVAAMLVRWVKALVLWFSGG